MKCDVAVTFEFDTRAPQTTTILDVEAGGAHTIAQRAIREARKTLKPVKWSSAVVVLFRKDDSDAEPEGL